jgi:hypothetical protein
MKSPPRQIPDDEAYEAVERFIAEHARRESAHAPVTAER